MLKQLHDDSPLFGSNASFVEGLYAAYLQEPLSVSAEWRGYFDALQKGEIPVESGKRPARPAAAAQGLETVREERLLTTERKQIAVLQMINAYRFLGVRHADLDPLQHYDKPHVPELDPGYYGLAEADMNTVFGTGSLFGPPRASLREILQTLHQTYCGKIGVEYMYITDTEQKRWIQNRIEGPRAQPDFEPEYKRHILERLTAAEGLEKYLHTRYVGQKRFSGEGGESMIPLLDNLLQRSGQMGVQQLVIGMAHRGRLNVLVNTLGKLPADLFQEFEGKHAQDLTEGDVKYHQGFSSAVSTPGGIMGLSLAFNPSHLEIVDPVVQGSVRARQHRLQDRDGDLVLPVLLHGDAAYSAQGVVMETLNLSQTRGYGTGGTVHIIINNQIGFTTSDPRDARSTLYCTDVSKMIEAPIFHVNGDDPEAVVMVTEIALDFRMQFHKDVVVDMVCYRTLGHNEQDEPMVTQPLMYKIIGQHPGTRKLYADKLEAEGVIDSGTADRLVKAYRDDMDAGRNPNKTIVYGYKSPNAVDWTPFLKETAWDAKVSTGLPLVELRKLAERLTDIPSKFKLHSRVEKIVSDRRLMGEGKLPLDWGMAETLAYAALLNDGYPIRISGQDSGRGTFFHRHAVLHDQNCERWSEGTYIPLRHIKPDQPDFVIIDSVLSEEAVLAFEYGYATATPDELVMWEAQFGDFANGAQVVIDQFIASGQAKWGRLCGLVMMLPHGYEGQGPEHSSARLERYLQLCAQYNIQVCVPTTPAQMFHLLRRQMVRPLRKPLVIMSPKSLLRHKESVSSLEDLVDGGFRNIISDMEELDPKKVRRLIACSGKVYFDLAAHRRKNKIEDVAIIRIEQLYPFPHDDFQAEVERYPHARDILWCQEEPRNQGAWHRIQHYLLRHKRADQVLGESLRPSSASPAAGYLVKHNEQQNELIVSAFRERI
ncbi:2-oxoglutarate dehydrogenase E1 component [Nitrosospira multiformis ATCC 25196]|uniref:2-oxoglutarate dehydrogenase E1 component n=1 Tax=Nitrosospira multiformis (strain ATCC 25196 / NCIMB 11849 / C 71) TaxID=323848 RepID=Q2YAR1_NITMU|nr:2-oxoglutarate dehydrogenase E1 component [Nitrosospira multiformis]ABB74160.1 2-oxoglutarate dehydrogenase E1 component [Nitrosospira multiformis ATCC 25196]SEF46308.1 2-oxoglutarate dehydrogenase E1 component [Nitrosospira multiformis ATCC 25196]